MYISPKQYTTYCLLPLRKHQPLRLNNNFGAQSLYFHFSSSAPCPTLKPHVATSVPRIRYRLLVRLYLVGFPYYILTAYKWIRNFFLLQEETLNFRSLFHSSRLNLLYRIISVVPTKAPHLLSCFCLYFMSLLFGFNNHPRLIQSFQALRPHF